MSPMQFTWARLATLNAETLHEIMAARQRVFVVEQNCPYLDADGYDAQSWHLIGRINGELAAYLRIVDAGLKYPEPSIGRVLTALPFRGRGLGQQLLREALDGCHHRYPGQGNRISAQSYLTDFYRSFGFEQVSAEYLEDDIPHIEMLRPCTALTMDSP